MCSTHIQNTRLIDAVVSARVILSGSDKLWRVPWLLWPAGCQTLASGMSASALSYAKCIVMVHARKGLTCCAVLCFVGKG
jgi:hypothetical protein